MNKIFIIILWIFLVGCTHVNPQDTQDVKIEPPEISEYVSQPPIPTDVPVLEDANF